MTARDVSRRRARWRATICAGLLIVLALVYGPPLARHAARAVDPLIFNDDARQQIVPFFRYSDGVPGDVITDYYLACTPVGFRALYRSAALAVDPAALSKALPYALLVVLLAAVAAAGYRLGGPTGATCAAALVLAGDTFLERMVGGLPRAFAHPLLAVAAAALVAGRPGWLAAATVAAMAFYPPAALTAGLALAAMLFALPAHDRGAACTWSVSRRLIVLAATAALALAVHAPTAVACAAFGPVIRPADVSAYREIGPGGRYEPDDRAPFPGFARQASAVVGRMFRVTASGVAGPVDARTSGTTRSRPWRSASLPELLAALLGVGLLGLAWSCAEGRRLLVLVAAAAAAHTLARLLAPHLHLPDRYVAYPVPVLVVLAAPAVAVAAGATIAARWPRLAATGATRPGAGGPRDSVAALALGAALGVAVLALVGARVSADAGWGVRIRPDTAVYRAVAALPADAVVAGWPTGPVDSVPYVARRRALLTFETHQALHMGYANEMRRRARALFEAYFASAWAPIVRLREELGVTHLLVDQRHFGEAPPAYFAPYDSWIAEAWTRGRRDGFVLASTAREPAVRFREGALELLDLHALP